MYYRLMEIVREQLTNCLREAETNRMQRLMSLHQQMKQMTEELNNLGQEVAIKDCVLIRREDFLNARNDITPEDQEDFQTRTREMEKQIRELRRQKFRKEAERWNRIETYMAEATIQRHLHALNGGKWDMSNIVLSLGMKEWHVMDITKV